MNSTLKYEIVGMLFIIIVGSLLHFTFELSGYNKIVGIFSAVNESTWEHMKLAFWPAIIFFLIEYKTIKKYSNFMIAKTIGIFITLALIPGIFYFYTSFISDNLIMDISTFVVSIILGQIISYRILFYKILPQWLVTLSSITLILFLINFLLLTFFPLNLEIFRDPISNGYGIIKNS
jgi:hypothetical protein